LALFGLDATGRHYITVLRQPAVFDIIEQTMRDGQFREARYLGAEGGRDTTWRVTVEGVASDSGSLTLVSFEDMTALEEAAQMRRDFVANVSHELRSPLTVLSGFIETLQGPARDDAAARERFLGIMAQEARRMNRLVADLLSLSRLEANERVRPRERVVLAEVLRTTLAALRPLIEESGIRLEYDDTTADAGRPAVEVVLRPGVLEALVAAPTGASEPLERWTIQPGRDAAGPEPTPSPWSDLDERWFVPAEVDWAALPGLAQAAATELGTPEVAASLIVVERHPAADGGLTALVVFDGPRGGTVRYSFAGALLGRVATND
jgi:hypothetical protein